MIPLFGREHSGTPCELRCSGEQLISIQMLSQFKSNYVICYSTGKLYNHYYYFYQ